MGEISDVQIRRSDRWGDFGARPAQSDLHQKPCSGLGRLIFFVMLFLQL